MWFVYTQKAPFRLPSIPPATFLLILIFYHNKWSKPVCVHHSKLSWPWKAKLFAAISLYPKHKAVAGICFYHHNARYILHTCFQSFIVDLRKHFAVCNHIVGKNTTIAIMFYLCICGGCGVLINKSICVALKNVGCDAEWQHLKIYSNFMLFNLIDSFKYVIIKIQMHIFCTDIHHVVPNERWRWGRPQSQQQ